MSGRLEPEFGPVRTSNPIPIRLADTARAGKLLGFAARVRLEEGLETLVSWWRSERRARERNGGRVAAANR